MFRRAGSAAIDRSNTAEEAQADKAVHIEREDHHQHDAGQDEAHLNDGWRLIEH